MKKYIETGSATLLGILMIIFGLNKFLGFIAVEPPDDPIAQQFMGAMFSSYLYAIVGIVEIIGGVLLFIPKLRLLGWMLQGVIIFNIVVFHIAHDFIGNGIWLVPTIFYVLLSLSQIKKVNSILKHDQIYTSNNITKRTLGIFILCVICSFSSSAQDNFQSFKVENSIIVEQNAEKVWILISDFKNLPKLVPDVVKDTKVIGKGIYATWNILLHNNTIVKEDMTYFNTESMELMYVMTKTPMPLQNYLAIQKVIKLNDKQSKVSFTTYYNALPQNETKLSTTFDAFQNKFLNNIKNNL